MNNILWLLVGRSGAGKDTLVDKLLTTHPNWKKVVSKTTRPPRTEEKNTHLFVTDAEYFADEAKGVIVAHNIYNGYHYWATIDQVEEANLYIVDIPGLIEIREKYRGNKKLLSVGLLVSEAEASYRMTLRGDDPQAIKERLKQDNVAFKNISQYVDTLIDCDDLSEDDVFIIMDDIIDAELK